MTNKTISNRRMVGGDYFELIYLRKDIRTLQDHLDKFDIQDYYIYKSTRHQRQVSIEELYEFKYSCYTFFKKDLYDKEYIDMWIEWMISVGGIQYLVKPVPPFNPSKIIIKK